MGAQDGPGHPPCVSVDPSVDDCALKYSIATLVTDCVLYRKMVQSFVLRGFGPEIAEFIYIDNTIKNVADGFLGVATLLRRARGAYVIVCHQDIEALDHVSRLDDILAQLENLDPTWAVCGNAGRSGKRYIINIEDRTGVAKRTPGTPHRIESLDENFLVLKAAAMIAPCRVGSGFHLYGTDLCIQADLRGWSSYAIDYMVRHVGDASYGVEYWRAKNVLENFYGHAFRSRKIGTLVRNMYISSPIQPPGFYLFRRWNDFRKWREKRHRAAPSGP